MRNSLFFILFITFQLYNNQGQAQPGDTVFNQSDKQGRKQGFWKVKYPNGVLKYTACFKDDKPVGMMKRYFDDSTIKAEMFFDASGTKAKAKLYYQDGPIAAEGNYINALKDSTWIYYSYYTKTISNRETYIKDKKNGLSISYFPNGKVAEELNWANGTRNGIWNQYYENGVMKVSGGFLNGKHNGPFKLNYPDNKPELEGLYKDDMREGQWVHHDPQGNNDLTIEYKNGIASNADELDAKEQGLLEQIEKKKGKIPEPDETNIMNPAK
jgi:antitoxin component YwqK of YwqJK toxin-antitoxin module